MKKQSKWELETILDLHIQTGCEIGKIDGKYVIFLSAAEKLELEDIINNGLFTNKIK